MPVDPAAGFPLDPSGRSAEQHADHERRIRAQEAANPTVQVGTGAPTTAPREGTLYVDSAALRLYVYAAGAWHYTGLT